MVKVITYGTYDMMHYGHIRLLERARELGDYLIVAVTADDFDKTRGKINVQQSLMERVESVRMTGIADEIIIEEYEGQKIDDICKYDIDIFTVGSDWRGKFDYLNEYCEVIYLDRTEGISSTLIRENKDSIRLGLVGEAPSMQKVYNECIFVNGLNVEAVFSNVTDKNMISNLLNVKCKTDDYDEFLRNVDAIYVRSHPTFHFEHVKKALEQGKHVLCEAPITLDRNDYKKLCELAMSKNCILMDAIKTAYNTAFSRMVLLAKSGKIGDIVSIDSTCTSLKKIDETSIKDLSIWNCMCDWGPIAMLPILRILGVEYKSKEIITHIIDEEMKFDDFTKINFLYDNAVASMKIGIGVKSEGELIISGTRGYIYVPAPWWKTDYFEVRYEKQEDNKRYFYQLEGEGIRYELVAFNRAINGGKQVKYIDDEISAAIINVISDFYDTKDVKFI